MGHRYDQNRSMEHLEERINQLMQGMQQRDAMLAALQAQITDNEEVQAGALAAAQEAANSAREALAAAQAARPGNNDQLRDFLKTLELVPKFNGNPIKLYGFIRSIETLLPNIDEQRNSADFERKIMGIRSRIIDEADSILEIYGRHGTWQDIKNTLITYYGDKRDEVSLTRDLYKITCGNSVEEFHEQIMKILSLLTNLININEDGAIKLAKQLLFQEMALKVFLGGLKEPLGPVIRAQSPKTLKEALRLCMEEKNYCHARQQAPPLPNKPKVITSPNYSQFNPIYNQAPLQNFYPAYNQQFKQQMNPMAPYQNYNQFPKMVQQPKPQYNQMKPFQNQFSNAVQPLKQESKQIVPYQPPKPTPMEVDPSLRSRNVNYMNRPQNKTQNQNGPHFQIEELRNIEQDTTDQLNLEQPEQNYYPNYYEPIYSGEQGSYEQKSENGYEQSGDGQNINFQMDGDPNHQT